MSRPRLPIAALALVLLAACQSADTPRGRTETAACAADRGIGGTGRPAGEAVADRGIGGTGVFGTITGFGSICVNGLEVRVAPDATVQVDGAPATAADLRVGQVVAVRAAGATTDIWTDRIAVFHLVSGPIWAAEADVLNVAGQVVALDGVTLRGTDLRPGTWVNVSGLRDLAGTIRATRIDGRAPGDVTVSGQVGEHLGAAYIGALRLSFAGVPAAPRGQALVVRGVMHGQTLSVSDVSAWLDRTQLSDEQRLLREGYVQVSAGRLRLGDGLEASVGPAFGSPPPANAPVVVELLHGTGQALLAEHWRPAPRLGGGGHAAQALPKTAPPAAQSAPSIASEVNEPAHDRDGRAKQ
jgi:hypothetical protein